MKKMNPFTIAFRKLLKNKLATICFILIIIELILVIFAPVFTPYDPTAMDTTIRLRPGFWAMDSELYVPGHWLGTDELGRDVWSRIIYGGRISLSVGFISTGIGLVFGTFFGLMAGYYKKLDNIIMRFMDILFTFPGILLALLIVAMLGVNVINATIAISIWSIPSFVLVNALPTIIVIATMRIASSILSIATLSYLGLGVPQPAPEWGGMISSARTVMYDASYLIVIPGIAVIITVVCFNILGDKLRDILDPSLKD